MKRKIIIAAIVVFWVVMTAWLIRFEAFPSWFANSLPGYRGILGGGPVILDAWTKILFQGKPIGYSHTQVDTDEKDPSREFLVHNKTLLQINLLGEPQGVAMTGEASLNALYELQQFYFVMSSRRYSVRIDGRRRPGEKAFSVRIRSGGSVQNLRVEIPDDTILYSPYVEMALSRLRPGQEMKVKTLDPATLSAIDILVRATGTETIESMGKEVHATLLTMDVQGAQIRAWMDPDGRIVRQETPFGWTMEACTADDVLNLEFESADASGDLARAVAIPCKGAIPDPRGTKALRLRLTGASRSVGPMETDRQGAAWIDDSTVDLDLRAAGVPGSVPPRPGGLDPYLAATAFAQSDHPDIVARAARITDGAASDVEKVLALYEWVYRKVKKEPTVSLPSALDVLKTMEGDCNEHTYLFVALARAAGIPAQIRVGLLYTEGAFYYHAWPAVYVGGWWELDPTIGQTAVDATHIALLEGELASQLKLLGLIGRLRAEVLDGPEEKKP